MNKNFLIKSKLKKKNLDIVKKMNIKIIKKEKFNYYSLFFFIFLFFFYFK